MLGSFFRFLFIAAILLRYGLDGEINPQWLPWYLRPFAYLAPGRYLFKRQNRGMRIRMACETLGPVFIKFGQLLSTRPDLIPADIFQSIRLLQDQVAPFSEKKLRAILNSAYGTTPEQVFKSFDAHTPLASASIAQVYSANLHSGEEVVVKVLRPNIEKVIARDLKCLRALAFLFEKFHPDGKRIHPLKIVAHYATIINTELDLQHEAANTALLGEHFKHSADLYVPQIHWDYCRKNILCAQRIYGIPIGNIKALGEAGIDFKALAERAVRIFFTQLLDNNFFHADMHPGNIFVDVSNAADAKFIALDCAIMGSLDEREKITLARLLNAIFSRDYTTAAQLFIRSGWVAATTNVSELAGAIRASNEPIFAKPISEISFAKQLLELFVTGRRFNMQVQPSLLLLQKTLFNIEGLGKQLHPTLDLWQTAQPFIERWLKQHFSPLNLLRRTRQRLPYIIEQIEHSLAAQKPNPVQLPLAQAPSNWRKLGALASVCALATISFVHPQALAVLPHGAWLLAGFVLSWLWFR